MQSYTKRNISITLNIFGRSDITFLSKRENWAFLRRKYS